MKLIILSTLSLGILLAGCVAPTDQSERILDSYPARQEEIKKLISDIFETARAKDMEQLDAYHLKAPNSLNSMMVKYQEDKIMPQPKNPKKNYLPVFRISIMNCRTQFSQKLSADYENQTQNIP